MTYEHFGVKLRHSNLGYKMTRENYAIINKKCSTHSGIKDYFEVHWGENRKEEFLKIFEDISAITYTDLWCDKQQEKVLKNYELNIRYFESLDKKKFEMEVKKFLKKNKKFKEIVNLDEASGKSGYYVMVLGEYCQMYVGTSRDIKKRIMNHWARKKQFDRLIFGNEETSKISIDSFRALDTTRVFVYLTKDTYLNEDNYINKIPNQYCCNRTGGGVPEFGALSILANAKYRDLKNKYFDKPSR